MTKPTPEDSYEIVAWATFDGEGSFDLMLYENNEDYKDQWESSIWGRRYGRKFDEWVTPLYRRLEMTEHTPHPHAALIAEWLKDTGQTISVAYFKSPDEYHPYKPCSIAEVIDNCYAPYNKYLLATIVEKRPNIVSSLTDEELLNAYWRNDYAKSADLAKDLRPVADAAAQRAIEELTAPPNAWFHDLFDESEACFAIAAVVRYLNELKEGKL